jgi:16S rRNA (cytidine1402-2'-O)-methyltransferase
MAMKGRLVLVATPIGNLQDLAPRAVEALRSAAAIACEDTRRTGRLLSHAGIAAPRLIVVNEHTEWTARQQVVELLDGGAVVCVVTDAGTPGISDPGEALVAAAIAAGHEVSTVPGPVAAIAALVVSGLPTARFVMEGFLPRRGPERKARLADVAAAREHTIVLYEAPHRLARTLGDLAAVLEPTRRIVLARELTKLHEEIWRGTLAEGVEWVAGSEPRGEFVIVIDRAPPEQPTGPEVVIERLRVLLADGLSTRDAVDRISAETGIARNSVYELALRLDD